MATKNSVIAQMDALLQKGGKKKGSGKGKKGRKIGRYSKHPSSVRYRSERRWESNKLKKLRRHIKDQPADMQARSALSRLGSGDDQSFLAGIEAA